MTEAKKEPNNGGPAFPLDLMVGEEHRWGHGMSLRDYFAAAAMQGIISDPKNRSILTELDISEEAYRQADAMIEHRTT